METRLQAGTLTIRLSDHVVALFALVIARDGTFAVGVRRVRLEELRSEYN